MPDATSETASLLEQAGEASELAREAFASGDRVVGLAALVLAAQLIQLERIREGMKP
jgi:hypothetical protein